MIPIFFRSRSASAVVALSLLLTVLVVGPAAADTLTEVRERGAVRCAVDGTTGFGGLAADGRPAGLDVAVCRAVAAAVLGSAEAVRIERINTANKFQALVDNEVDIALGMVTHTYGRDTTLDVRFVTPTFHDGQSLMVWDDSRIRSLAGATGRKVCVQSGTTSAANLADLSQMRNLKLELLKSASTEERLQRFLRRDCDMISGDRAELAALRATRTPEPNRWRMLDDTLSREPLGPYVRANDERWFGIVRWVIHATLVAELHGLNATTLERVGANSGAEQRLLAGLIEGAGAGLGLDDAWARNVITQVGNYAEIFADSVGAGSPLGLERGANALWRDGGLFFPPPLR